MGPPNVPFYKEFQKRVLKRAGKGTLNKQGGQMKVRVNA
jgi:hypothetical protein